MPPPLLDVVVFTTRGTVEGLVVAAKECMGGDAEMRLVGTVVVVTTWREGSNCCGCCEERSRSAARGCDRPLPPPRLLLRPPPPPPFPLRCCVGRRKSRLWLLLLLPVLLLLMLILLGLALFQSSDSLSAHLYAQRLAMVATLSQSRVPLTFVGCHDLGSWCAG
jgi:hypothetical protein